MSRKGLVISAAVALGAIVTFLPIRDAEACGGCFGPPPPPTESPTVVTDHRMILTISKDQSTLYDQIRYTGSPASFAWVLPIAGTVDVGLSANVVFQTLDSMTQQTIIAPPLNCPPQPSGCNFGARASADNAGGSSSGSGGSGVTVLKEEVVGPYETVQLKSDDPTALNTWLDQNGFEIADDIKPVIAQYVTEKFNFLALKLVPGKGVQDMRPVRVTTTGAGAVLPLRMVAAGVGPTVGITLWVIGEGRYEPQNFPTFYIKTEELLWDWTQQKSNYIDLRAKKTAENAGRAWETETSTIVYRQNVESVVSQGTWNGTSSGTFPQTDEERAAQDYLAVEDSQGNVTKTAVQVRQEDMDTLFYGIPTATSRVTRIRADLSRTALDQDLQMTASSDQAILANVRQVIKELNQPQCPVWDGCQSVGTAPRDEAFARSTPSGSSSSSCATTPPNRNRALPAGIAAGSGLLALGLVHVVRRRRSAK
jgi:hypothetical protein